MEKPIAWIKRQVEVCKDIQTVYDQYPNFLRETGSIAGMDSYKRKVRKMFEKKNGSPKTKDNVIVSREFDGSDQTIITKSSSIRTLNELLTYTKVDQEKWSVLRHVVNSWGSETNPSFQVKAWLALRLGHTKDTEAIRMMVDDAKQYAPKYPKLHDKSRNSSGYLFELSLYDHHFGQQSWGEETGSVNYDVSKARDLAVMAVEYQLSRAKEINAERILVIVGNDFFNVNSKEDTTTHGTRQAEDDRWHKTFRAGRELWVEIIEMCLQIAPVDVIVIPGNHDEERIFYLGDALQCWFHNAEEVNVMNGPKKRKYYEWGLNLLGFTHGSEERKGRGVLVNLMATEMPLAWSRTKYRIWRKGHLHAASATAFQVIDEEQGVREEVMPSMVALDDYHAGKGYSHMRETIGNAWHKTEGRTDQFMFHPPDGM